MFISNTKRSWRRSLDYAFTESMKSRDSHTLASLIRDGYTHPFEAVLHLLSRFVRESDCEDVSRRYIALQEISDPSDQGAGLARSRSCDDKIALIISNGRLSLSRVELQLFDKQLRVLTDCPLNILVVVPHKLLTQLIRSHCNGFELFPHYTVMGLPNILLERWQGQLNESLG